MTLLAESTTGAMHCAEAISKPGVAPEDIALTAARALLSEIKKGGVVDRQHQSLVLMMMVLGSEDVGRCRMGEPTARTYVLILSPALSSLTLASRIQLLRDVKECFGTAFKITSAEPNDPDSTELVLSCYGIGYVNANRSLA